MSGGGATTTTNSCSGSPILHGPTTHRRRVADLMDAEKGGVDCYASNNGVDDNEDDDSNGNNGGGGGHIRYSSSLRKRGRCAVSGACAIARRNVGRTIFWALMAMVVVSVFVKVSFFMVGRSNVEEEEEALVNGKKSRNHQEGGGGGGGLLIRQTTFKDDWVLMAQKVVSDDVESSSRSVLSKGLLEKYPVAVSSSPH